MRKFTANAAASNLPLRTAPQRNATSRRRMQRPILKGLYLSAQGSSCLATPG
jgi:hypothetical protein